MNLKAFGTFVLALGIALSVLGGGIIIVNQPLSPKNMDSERARSDGVKLLITGMIANFFGIAVMGIAVKVASPKRPAISLRSTGLPGTVTRRMTAVDMGKQTHGTDSQPLPRCPKCGAPTYDLNNHRCRASVPDRNY